MRLSQRVTALAAVSLLALSACSSDTSDDAGSNGGVGAAGADGEVPADVGEDTLIIYTNGEQWKMDWIEEEAAEAGFDIAMVSQGGGDVANRILAEAGNPVADVLYGLNNVYLAQLVEAGTIEPYTPEWADEVDPEAGDASGAGHHWPVVEQGIILPYDADVYSEEEAPQDWPDLWEDERFHGRYQSETDLGGATTQLVMSGILVRHRDDDGELGISEEGWGQVAQYFEHGSPAEEGTNMWARLAEGEIDMGQFATGGLPSHMEEYGVNAEVAIPEVGIPYAIEQVAILAGTDKSEDAQEFVDWFGSAEVQAAYHEAFDGMPVNERAIAEADPEIVEFHQDLPRQDIDWEFVAEMLPEWIEKIELEYVT